MSQPCFLDRAVIIMRILKSYNVSVKESAV